MVSKQGPLLDKIESVTLKLVPILLKSKQLFETLFVMGTSVRYTGLHGVTDRQLNGHLCTSSCVSDLETGSMLAGGFTRTITCGASRKACSAGETNFFQLVSEYLVEKVSC